MKSSKFFTLLMLAIVTISFGWLGIGSAAAGVTEVNKIEPAIFLAQSRGIISGDSAGDLGLERGVTRAEFVKMLVAGMGYTEIPRHETVFFSDLDGHWAKDVVELARELGLVQGDEQRRFWPDQEISRGDADALISQVLTKEGVASLNRSSLGENIASEEPYLRREAVKDILTILEQFNDKYDLYGKIIDLDSQNGEITLATSSGTRKLKPAPDMVVIKNEERVALDNSLLGNTVSAVFDANGQIAYLEAAAIEAGSSLQIEETIYDKDNLIESTLKNDDVDSQISPITDEEDDITYDEKETPLATLAGNNEYREPKTLAGPGNQPELSLEVTKREIGVQGFIKQMGADGQGQVIAIIDSGVDPGHPDLLTTTNGESKIAYFVDFTNEGYFNTIGIARVNDNIFNIDNNQYKISLDGIQPEDIRYGFVLENKERAVDVAGIDFNMDGDENDDFAVVLAKSRESADYDTLIIDTDNDQDFSDEKPMTVFNKGGGYNSFIGEKPEQRFNFVLADIDDDGRWFRLGFDGNGHGTHVAGIAAANGNIKGVAPGAQLIIIKAVRANGKADVSAVEKGIWYAGEQGADIVNLSLGMYVINQDKKSDLSKSVNEVTANDGTVFAIAVGNRGPGLSSVATPADADAAISVGAYISPEMWRTDYGWKTNENSVWYFSSMGPRKDGYAVPYVVAPGSAISTVPLWNGRKYGLLEGTSMAAPHVAGSVALLLDAADKTGIKLTPDQLRRALGQGAREMPDLQAVEAGHGVIDLGKTWAVLQQGQASGVIDFNVSLVNNAEGQAVYGRDTLPGRLNITVTNQSQDEVPIQWQSSADWIKTDLSESTVGANDARTVALNLEGITEPGLYSGFLYGVNKLTSANEMELMTTVIVPQQLDVDNSFREFDTLGAGQFKRYYFVVPPGIRQFTATLSVPQDDEGKYLGRARLHIIDPLGVQKKMTDYAGYGPPDTVIRNRIGLDMRNPKAGLWEIVVYSSATLSLYGETDSQYNFYFNLVPDRTVARSSSMAETKKAKDWYVSIVPKEIIPDQPNIFTLQVRDKTTNMPIEGFVMINGRVYELDQGRARFTLIPDENEGKIGVAVIKQPTKIDSEDSD